MSDWNDQTIKEFRENEGRVGGVFEGAPLLLLHTTGRRTGDRSRQSADVPARRRPLGRLRLEGRARRPSALAPQHRGEPEATIEVGTDTIPVKATVLREGPERDELYARQVAAYPQFGEYEEKTEGHRTIPVIILERAA